MARKKKTWFVILGLLSWQPMSGYYIRKLVELGLGFFWSESYGQLYPALEQLVAEGLAVRKAERRTSRRQRHLYSITPRGRRRLEQWLREPPDEPRVRNEAQVKFFLSSRRSLPDTVEVLDLYRSQQRERLKLYKESEAVLSVCARDGTLPEEIEEVLPAASGQRTLGKKREHEPLIFYLTLRHGIRTVEARLAWCEEAIKALRREIKKKT